MKNTIKAIIFALMLVSVFPFTQMTYATTVIQITDLTVTPNSIDFSVDPSVAISYKTNTEAYVTLVISQGSKIVGTFVNGQYLGIGSHAYYWNGKYGSDTQVGKSGEKVDEGVYSFTIIATKLGGANEDIKTGTITVSGNTEDSDSGDFSITDVDLDQDTFDPEDDQEVEITFEINDDADVTIKIYDEDDDLVRELVNSDSYDQGENSETWDGEDDDGDIVSEGDYTYKIHADNGPEEDDADGIVTVEEGYDGGDSSEAPRVEDVLYLTKESFDSEDEETYLVFNVTASADIEVEITNLDDDSVETIYDKNNRPSGLQKIKWDSDDIEYGDYKYEITVKNSKGKDHCNGTIEVKEDEADNGAPNIYNDNIDIDDIPYSAKDGELSISFELEEDADTVTVEIRQDNKSIDKILDDEDLESGTHTAKWDGKNKGGKVAEEGVYEYRIIARNSDGTDTERGNFSVSKSTSTGSNSTSESCAGFKDIRESYKFCEAITWAKEAGVFTGYPDNSFKPYQPIRRSEILKVVLEAFEVNLIETNGGNSGFKDVKGSDWYVDYLATAITKGIVAGYDDKTFRPDELVTRVQALKIMLEAAKREFSLSIKGNDFAQPYIDIPAGKWYTRYAWMAKNNKLTDDENYFFPLNPMTRGEMADLLYRFHQEGLDQ